MRRRNPIFSRWDDPFFGTTKEFLAGLGGGDPAKGYDIILDRGIADWNRRADENPNMPHTSREHGLDWIIIIGDDEGNAERKAEFEAQQEKREKQREMTSSLTTQYEDKFGKFPDVTLLKITAHNREYYDKKVKEALDRGTPLTPEEENDIEMTIFKEFYDRLDKGEIVHL